MTNLAHTIRCHLETLDRTIEGISDQVDTLENMRLIFISSLLEHWCQTLSIHEGDKVITTFPYNAFDTDVPIGTVMTIHRLDLNTDYRSIYGIGIIDDLDIRVRFQQDDLVAGRIRYLETHPQEED